MKIITIRQNGKFEMVFFDEKEFLKYFCIEKIGDEKGYMNHHTDIVVPKTAEELVECINEDAIFMGTGRTAEIEY